LRRDAFGFLVIVLPAVNPGGDADDTISTKGQLAGVGPTDDC
jgi:hypothetical protein